jgi:predicted esterase YcpF (UPF0227 family)
LRIAYLHGFNSGPASIKGRLLGEAIAALPVSVRPEYFLPRLQHEPREAIHILTGWIESRRDVPTLVGSSLGGFYAMDLAERYGAKAVLINPSLRPWESLAAYLGAQRNPYTNESYELRCEHLAQLEALRVARITRPERYLLLAQAGDELLDYRDAVAFLAGAWQFVQGGGDHAYQNFAADIPAILRFAGVDLPAGIDRR